MRISDEAVGNAAAMREALIACFDFIMRLDRAFNPFMQNLLENAIAKAQAALSAPPRQCDVGTAKEQEDRFYSTCKECDKCNLAELIDKEDCTCPFIWTQSPYDEERKGEEK